MDYLTYAQPALSMNDTEFFNGDNPIYVSYTVPLWEDLPVDEHDAELISIQEALEADNLIFWWQYEVFMWGYLQMDSPVQYYRVKDYEPVTVIGITIRRDSEIPRWFAIRDRVIQSVVL